MYDSLPGHPSNEHSCIIAGLQKGGTAAVSGKWHRERRRRGVYMSGTAVCAARMGVNFRQFSGTVPL